MKFRRSTIAAVACLLLAGCASPIKQAEQFARQGEWLQALQVYRKAQAEEPGSIDYQLRLKQAELKAADYYHQRGASLAAQGDFDGAAGQYLLGLAAMPDHAKLMQAMAGTAARKEAQINFEEGRQLLDGDKKSEAAEKFRRALEAHPGHAQAADALEQLRKDTLDKGADGLVMKSREPITLNFRQTDVRQAFEFLGKSFGINMMFDDGVRGAPLTLFAKGVSFDQGFNLMLSATKSFHKKLGPNTLMIIPDTKEKRGQYEDHLVRTFQLNSISAKEMADILKGLVSLKKVIVNDRLNAIVVRDTADVIKLAEKIIESNDRKPAELILDVEILEINRTRAEKLGLDLSSYSVSINTPAFQAGTSPRQAFRSSTITLPSATLQFFKQDVNAKTLANPKIRVLNGKSAKIHIGDRVPLRAATIQDATGQVRTTYDYRDIGIRLMVDPIIHLDNSSTVKMVLEVSSLGENLGTVTEPAFRIGTRNAETLMLLRDGETAVLGGLIRDEERNTRARIPGVGDIPVVGSLFTSHDDSGGRTDVLLTITPHVMRGWEQLAKGSREFYSGTESTYTVRPVFAEVDSVADVQMKSDGAPAAPGAPATGAPALPAADAPARGLAVSASAVARAPSDAAPAAPAAAAAAVIPAATIPAASGLPALAFSESVYEVAVGQELEVKLLGSGLENAASVATEVLYSSQVLGFVRAERGELNFDTFNAQPDAAQGLVRVSMGAAKAAASSGAQASLARLVFVGSRPGISYLVYRTPALKAATGEIIHAQMRASRVVVK